MQPTPTDENSQSAGDTVSTTTFIAVVVPISVVTSLLCVILLVFWRRTLLQSGQLPNNRHDSREVMIVNNTFSPDHLTSTPTPPDVPRRPAKESYFSSVESSAYYVAPAPTGKAQATGNKASSIYEYIEPKHTDYYLELVA
ncbi:uncharacterized protein LOC110977685 [Acanthaster planci]|uniref:Uncharacterized protein LOC110977685 n=1 Tax=Acanthaster planci TaxID=133434 RepID=A0A8B7Y574_ACAPL|nr:uncharacterized protein LOC110977685 [Acanthaster planci]